jgi:hypothetical protein
MNTLDPIEASDVTIYQEAPKDAEVLRKRSFNEVSQADEFIEDDVNEPEAKRAKIAATIEEEEAVELLARGMIPGKNYSAQFTGNGAVYIEELDVDQINYTTNTLTVDTIRAITLLQTPMISTFSGTNISFDSKNLTAIMQLTATNIETLNLLAAQSVTSYLGFITKFGDDATALSAYSPGVIWQLSSSVITSVGTNNTIASIPYRPNTLANNGDCLVIVLMGQTANNANAKRVSIQFGNGVSQASINLAANTANFWTLTAKFWRSAAGFVRDYVFTDHGGTPLNHFSSSFAVQNLSTGSYDILVQSTTTTAGDITLYNGYAEVIRTSA